MNGSSTRRNYRQQQVENRSLVSRWSNALFSTIWCWICSFYTCLMFMFKKQYRAIRKHQSVRYEMMPLSPLTLQRLSVVKRKTLVLDLDETLIHSHHDGVLRPTVKPGTPPDFILKVCFRSQIFPSCNRRSCDNRSTAGSIFRSSSTARRLFFLSVVSQWYDLCVYTASMEVYGSSVADKLDRGRGLLRRRYFRQHCTVDYSGYTKDLSAVHSDLTSVFILDNSPAAYRQFPHNAIPIKSWFCDPSDTCLLNLLPFLDALRFTSDVRSILSRNIHKPPAVKSYGKLGSFDGYYRST
ncbi:FCP1-like proteiny domain-containing protein [Aphelenchoides besseyi]|nr:FCP1-like proteiny domain-containing protein [Aphelenchoides besseyi]